MTFTQLITFLFAFAVSPAVAQSVYYEAPDAPGPLIQRTGYLPYTNGDRSAAELLNDGPTSLSPIARVTVYGGQTIVKGPLWFSPKRSHKTHILFSRPDPRFHILFWWGG